MYSITPYTYNQSKRIGVTVKPSLNKTKKIDVMKKETCFNSPMIFKRARNYSLKLN